MILFTTHICSNIPKDVLNRIEILQDKVEEQKIEKIIDGVCYEIVSDTSGIYANVIGLEKKPVFIKIPEYIKVDKKKYPIRKIISLGSGGVNLKGITLPKSLKWIHGFMGCYNLTEIVIPESVVKIDAMAFKGCKNLRKVSLGNGLCEIGIFAFQDCVSLSEISLPNTLEKIGGMAFEGCTSLKNIVIPNSVKELGTGIFKDCSNLSSIQLNNIKEIPSFMFSGCKSLKDITLSRYVKGIGSYCFNDCTALTHVIFSPSSNVETIGENAFANCISLQGTIPDDFGLFLTLKHIGKNAFRDCSSLNAKIVLKVDSVLDETFYNCTSLKEIYFGDNLIYIGNSAFYNTSLEKVFLKGNIKFIDYGAFAECKKLKEIHGLTSDIKFGGKLYSIFDKKTDITYLERSYKYFASETLEEEITKWQSKKKYESTEEWRKRVNLETRQKRYNELKDSVRLSYIKRFSPDILKCKIVSYDADAGVFSLKTENLNKYLTGYDISTNSYTYGRLCDDRNVYVKVPANEAEAFEKNWDKVILKPTYCITKDYLDVASCTFTLNGKTYKSPLLYDDETADLNIEFPPLDLDLLNSANQDMAAVKDKTIDENIPTSGVINDKTFVVIIGNENYKQVARVPYALNDAIIFKDYCKKTLGVPDKNIRSYPDATYAMMLSSLKDIQNIAEAYKGDINVIFYYAGHGVPNEKDQTTYLLPTDADGSQTEICMSVSRLYKGLAEMKAKSVTVFMDACFSGSQRGEGMITSARGVAIKAKEAAPQGNMVIFTAASGDETAYPYKEKGHGMFTYYLLKKLRDTKGDVTLGELGQYITDNVRQQSVVVNRRVQTPTVMPAGTLGDGWKNIKLK